MSQRLLNWSLTLGNHCRKFTNQCQRLWNKGLDSVRIIYVIISFTGMFVKMFSGKQVRQFFPIGLKRIQDNTKEFGHIMIELGDGG